jgi:N-methylhydantoinase A
MLNGPLRIAVDIGGTFTDLQILEESSGRHHAYKTPTTPEDPSQGLMDGVRGAAERFGFELGQVSTLMHGTTIATNAVLERKLPPGALVTTRGFRDVLEIGRHVRREVYASVAEPRRLLIDRAHRFEVDERTGPDGGILAPLDEASVHAAAERIAASDARSVAVCLLHAYANEAHERRVGEILAGVLGHDFISLSHRVSPELREFERTSTTVLNALLMPVVTDYLKRLGERMSAAGFDPALYLVQSNGGVTTPDAAAEQPARLLLSGPSGGALAAETLGRRLAEPDLVAMDMGGTSFDVSIVHGGKTRLVNEGAVDDCPVRLPMIEIRTIGAGGGSIARADETGRLLVGPESAGAVPGPVAYGKGGEAPTVSDANVALGRIDPGYFLGGVMPLDGAAARQAIHDRVAAPLSLEDTEAAEGIVRVAISSMAAAIRLSLFEKGLDPKDFALVTFGGAGGLHAAEVARELGVRRVIFPRDAGTLSAWGMLFSDVVHDGARSRLMVACEDAVNDLQALADALLAEGRAQLERDRVSGSDRRFALAMDMRYAGQAYEITVPVDGVDVSAATVDASARRFHEMHEAQYAHSNSDERPEVVTLRVSAIGKLRHPAGNSLEPGEPPQPKSRRGAFFDGHWVDTAVYARDSIGAGARIQGPALVEEAYATTVLPAGWQLHCTDTGELVAEAE